MIIPITAVYTVLGLILVIASVIGVWRWLLGHCDRAAVADWGSRWLNRLDGLNRIFCRRFHRLAHDPLPLADNGGALVVSNHVSGLDPLLMIAASQRPLRFIIAEEQYNRWWLRWLFDAIGCIPVARSSNPQQAFLAARQALERGEVVALFPHGRIHLDHEPPRQLKRGVALLAQLTNVPVWPLRIEGVRGQGMTIMAVVLRSRVRIRCFERLSFDHKVTVKLAELGRLLQGRQAVQNQLPGT